jgi:hypothetical protein
MQVLSPLFDVAGVSGYVFQRIEQLIHHYTLFLEIMLQ